MNSVWDGPVDLFLGGRCVGCARGGSVVCQECLRALPQDGFLAWPAPTPPGLVAPYALTEYAGLSRAMILGHKERGLLALGHPLGRLLALSAARAAIDTAESEEARLLLVPVPSRAASVRSRGHDPMLSITRHATRILGAAGWRALCAPLLVPGPGLADQSGLDAAARAANVSGSMRVRVRAMRRLFRALPLAAPVLTLICDDVLTTGATAREAQRATEVAGIPVAAVATVAATRRRAGIDPGETSGDSLSPGAATH